MGFFREGFSANSPYYKYLSYFKILNIKCKTGTEHKKWINNNIEHITKAKHVIVNLKRDGFDDIGEYLYHNGRNALSHANVQKGEPIVDVCSYTHWQNIVCGNELLEELIEYFMINELSVPNY